MYNAINKWKTLVSRLNSECIRSSKEKKIVYDKNKTNQDQTNNYSKNN